MPKTQEIIYLETSVISAFFDFKKQNNERRKITRKFFQEELGKYHAFISDAVMKELQNTPNPKHKENFLDLVRNIPSLYLNRETIDLAQSYIKNKIIPVGKLFDAYHLSIAIVNKIDILVSWNYNHLANKITQDRVNAFNVGNNYSKIVIEFPTKLLTPK